MTPGVNKPIQPGNDALEAQLTALGATVQQGFQRIEQTLLGLDQRLRGLENREAGCQPLINSRLDAAWKAIDELKADLLVLNNKQEADHVEIARLGHSLALAKWVGGVVSTAFISWVIAELVGLIR